MTIKKITGKLHLWLELSSGLVVCMLANLLRGFHGLHLLLKQGERVEMESYTLILLPETAAKTRKLGSFSFLNFLVICSYDYENCFDTVLRHEHVHNSILLKDRIKMIYSKSTSYWSLFKYILIVPIMAFAVLKTAARNQTFIIAEHLSDKMKVSYMDPVQDSISGTRKKEKVKRNAYSRFRLKEHRERVDTLIDKADHTDLGYVSRVSKYQDSLWEAYDPKAGQINYYNKAKIKRIKPYYPALEMYGKQFGNSLDFSAKDAPKTHLQYFTLGVKSPYESYPPTNIKKVIP